MQPLFDDHERDIRLEFNFTEPADNRNREVSFTGCPDCIIRPIYHVLFNSTKSWWIVLYDWIDSCAMSYVCFGSPCLYYKLQQLEKRSTCFPIFLQIWRYQCWSLFLGMRDYYKICLFLTCTFWKVWRITSCERPPNCGEKKSTFAALWGPFPTFILRGLTSCACSGLTMWSALYRKTVEHKSSIVISEQI